MQPSVRTSNDVAALPLALVLAVAVVTLLLSPIIAVWAVGVGAIACLAGALFSSRLTVGVGLGLLLGAAPYFALALVQ